MLAGIMCSYQWLCCVFLVCVSPCVAKIIIIISELLLSELIMLTKLGGDFSLECEGGKSVQMVPSTL